MAWQRSVVSASSPYQGAIYGCLRAPGPKPSGVRAPQPAQVLRRREAAGAVLQAEAVDRAAAARRRGAALVARPIGHRHERRGPVARHCNPLRSSARTDLHQHRGRGPVARPRDRLRRRAMWAGSQLPWRRWPPIQNAVAPLPDAAIA